jgi:hypothetical protein
MSTVQVVDATSDLDQNEQRWIRKPRQDFKDHDLKRRSHRFQAVSDSRQGIAGCILVKCLGDRMLR